MRHLLAFVLVCNACLTACGTMPAHEMVEQPEGSAEPSRWACSWQQLASSYLCEAGPRLFSCVVQGERVTWSYYVEGHLVDSRDVPTLADCIARCEAGAAAGEPSDKVQR